MKIRLRSLFFNFRVTRLYFQVTVDCANKCFLFLLLLLLTSLQRIFYSSHPSLFKLSYSFVVNYDIHNWKPTFLDFLLLQLRSF